MLWRRQGCRPQGSKCRAWASSTGARTFRRAFAEDRVVPVPSLLLRSAMAEARTIADPAGNAKLSKGSQGGRRFRARDDAAAAAILAVSAGVRHANKLRGVLKRGLYLGLA